MIILDDKSVFPQNVSLILGFFDGIHAGHQNVLKNTPQNKKVLVTFSSSPVKYFGEKVEYIYSREYNYRLAEEYGVDYIYEQDFSKLAQMEAKDYLDKLLQEFSPISITTGFNNTFGANREGTPKLLEENKGSYQYFCTPPTKIENTIVSSSIIKEFLKNGNIENANKFLTRKFSLKSTVVEGAKLGRKLGFPTANMHYPQNIVKIPYGVYRVEVFGMPAMMNWGVKPTIGSEEIMEVHIPNFKGNLYGKELCIEVISKIRDEKKFESLEDLKNQIKEDIKLCLK